MITTSAKSYTNVLVFRDHAAWSEYEKWFMVPGDLLAALFVAEYNLDDDNPNHSIAQVEEFHPGCVYIYAA